MEVKRDDKEKDKWKGKKGVGRVKYLERERETKTKSERRRKNNKLYELNPQITSHSTGNRLTILPRFRVCAVVSMA